MIDILQVTTDDGEYKVCQRSDGSMYVLRHGELWIDELIMYSKLILTLAQDLQQTRKDFRLAKEESLG